MCVYMMWNSYGIRFVENPMENNYSHISLLLFKIIPTWISGKQYCFPDIIARQMNSCRHPLLTTPCRPRAEDCLPQCRCTSAVIRHAMAPYRWTWLAYYVAPSRSCHPLAASSHRSLPRSHTRRVVYLNMKRLLLTTVRIWGDIAGTSNQT